MSARASAAGATRRGRRLARHVLTVGRRATQGSSHEDHDHHADGRHHGGPRRRRIPAEPAGVVTPPCPSPLPGSAVAALVAVVALGSAAAAAEPSPSSSAMTGNGAQQGYAVRRQQGYDQYGGHGYVEAVRPHAGPRRPLRARHNLRAGPAWRVAARGALGNPPQPATPVVRTCELRCSGRNIFN